MTYGAPFMQDYTNLAESNNPNFLQISDTKLSMYFRRQLLQKAISVYKWKLPETWNEGFFTYCLYCLGFIGVINTDKYGLIPQNGALGGYTVQYQPAYVMYANPLFDRSYKLTIGEDTEIIYLKPDYAGIMDIVGWYADMMSISSQTLTSTIFNSRLAYVFGASDTAAAETFYKMCDQIAAGKPAVAAGKKLFTSEGAPLWQFFTQNLQQNFIAEDIQMSMRHLMDEFCTAVGIPNANREKKERLITAEAESNTIEVFNLAESTLKRLQEGCERVHRLFGLTRNDLWVEMREPPAEVDEVSEEVMA